MRRYLPPSALVITCGTPFMLPPSSSVFVVR
jgi:hypothetical protein